MVDKKDLLIRVFGGITIIILLIIITVSKPYNTPSSPTETCKEDSLTKVINQLIIEKEYDEDGWDKKEKRYEQILFEYQHGLDHLKYHHTEAYKEFHRIIGYRENYSHEIERDNNKRLNTDKW